MDGPKPRNGERPPGIRVLVVDDSQENARMMWMLLKGEGHEVKPSMFRDDATAEISVAVVVDLGDCAEFGERVPASHEQPPSRTTEPADPACQTHRQRRERPIGRLAWSVKNQTTIEDERPCVLDARPVHSERERVSLSFVLLGIRIPAFQQATPKCQPQGWEQNRRVPSLARP